MTDTPDSAPGLSKDSRPQKNQHVKYLKGSESEQSPCSDVLVSQPENTQTAFPAESKERAKAKKLAGHIARARKQEVEERCLLQTLPAAMRLKQNYRESYAASRVPASTANRPRRSSESVVPHVSTPAKEKSKPPTPAKVGSADRQRS